MSTDSEPQPVQDNIKPKTLLETYKALPQAGASVIRAVMLLNGASVVALLAFVGNIIGKVEILPDFRGAFSAYILGVFIAGVATYTSSVCQFLLYEEQLNIYIYNIETPPALRSKYYRWKYWFNLTSALVITGLIGFLMGSFQAINILNDLHPKIL